MRGVLIALGAMAVAGFSDVEAVDEAETADSGVIAAGTYIEEFDGELGLNWRIENEDAQRYRLDVRPGELVLKTAIGKLGTRQRVGRLSPLNFFLWDEPIAAGRDFVATLHVSEFEPETHWHQVALVLYQNGGNLVKLCAQRADDDKTNMVGYFQQVGGKREKLVHEPIEIDGPFWLRLARNDELIHVGYSNDGDQFEDLGEFAWKRQRPAEAISVGFSAFNGPYKPAKSIDAVIESFEVMLEDAE